MASGCSGGLKNCHLWGQTLAFPPKSEFVEKARKIKNYPFRQFIYVNLGPRACALPVADTAQAQCVPRSARNKPALSGKVSAGHRKRTAVEKCKGKPLTCKNSMREPGRYKAFREFSFCAEKKVWDSKEGKVYFDAFLHR